MTAAFLLIATPAYQGKVCTAYAQSMVWTVRECDAAGVALGVQFLDGCPMLGHARNSLVGSFLSDPRASHLLFIDVDMGWQPSDVLRLLRHDLDVVGGIGPSRSTKFISPHDIDPRGALSAADDNGLIEVPRIGTGFLMLKRKVFERLIATGAVETYLDDRGEHDQHMLNWFQPRVVRGRMVGEDFSFCELWRSRGGRIYADTTIALSHFGEHEYTGARAQDLPPLGALKPEETSAGIETLMARKST